jgi:hypothetical protein
MKLIHLDHPKIIETTQKLLDVERRFYQENNLIQDQFVFPSSNISQEHKTWLF